MLINKKLLCICLIMFFISISAVSAEDLNQANDTVAVSNDDILSVNDIDSAGDEIISLNDNSQEILGDDAETFAELKEIIYGNESGSTVYLGKDYIRTSNEVQQMITISKELTIDGQGHTLDGNGYSYIFSMSTPSKVVFRNLTFTGCKGSALSFGDSNTALCEIINCTFEDNYIQNGNGNSIKFKGEVSNSNFTNVTFIRNIVNITSESSNLGGAVYAKSMSDCVFDNVTFSENRLYSTYKNADYNRYYFGTDGFSAESMKNTKFVNCNFDSNNASTGFGGVFHIQSSNNNTFSHINATNNFGGRGAVIYFQYSTKDTFYDVFFENNTADYDGGVIFYKYTVKHSTFNHIKANNNTADSGGFISQSHSLNTGYLTYNNFNVTFYDSEFTNNKANGSTYSGGVFELYCGVNGFVFENVRFINNTAHEAGVFYMGGQTQGTVLNKNATFIGVNFTNNSAYYGGVFSSGSTPPSDLYFYDCNFDSNNAQVGGVFEFSTSGEPFGRGYVFNNTNFTNNIASEGGIIYTFGALVSDITFNHTNFINNTAENWGGGIIDQGSAYLPESAQNSNMVFDNCNFTDNYGADGVMGLSSGSKDCKILNSNFESNDGGVGVFSILRTSNNLVVDNCNFTNNSGTTSGAFYFYGSCINLTVSNSNFENNTVDDDFDSRGSTITFASRYSSVFSENNTFVNVTFKNNTGNNGGAVWIYGENTNFTNVSFINNTARKQGGAVYTNSPSDFTQGMDTFTGCTFEGNEAEGSGAAIYSNYQQIGLKDSNFTNNSGKNIVYIGNFGGNVSNCNFTNNTCEEDVIHQSSGPNGLNISGSTFEDNIAGKQIVYVESNSLHVSDSNFTNNTGNAIKVMNSNNNIIEGSSFKNHNVTDGGAAIYLSDSDTNISGSTFENNTGEYGGAIFASNSNVNISGSTFLDNHANNGGAINIVDSEMVSISDSNFRYNTAYHGSAINFEGVGSASVNDSNFSDNHVIQLDLIVTPDSYTMSIMANLTGGNTQVNAIYSDSDMVSYSNVLYLTDMGVLNTDEEKSIYLRGVPYQNVTIFVYDDEGNFLFNLTNLTDNKGIAMFYDLGLEPGNYSVDAYHYENTQYAYAEGESEFKQLGNFTLLQILIDNTEDGGTLDLTQDFTYSIGLDDDITEGIIINKNITINGNGHFIDALYKSRIFDIQGLYYDDPDTGETILLPMNVHLTNMTLLNGNSDLGGAVHASYINNLTIDYCDFINNTGTGKYEWVHHDGWVLGSADSAAVALDYTVNSTISDCSFINNTIYNDGVGGYSGALSIYGINNTITRCEFINNSVWNYGGAIGIKYGSVNNTIENSIFENNSAWYGGAIYSDWSENSTFRNLTFKNNTADNGGAMYLYGSVNTVIEDSVFENNNNASEYSCGGAIYALPYSMLVKNSTFKNNTGVTGGAIYLQRPWDDSFIFNITIEESKFIDNNVTSNGGAIGLNGIVNFTVKDSQFINNSAVYGAGALSIDGSRHLSVEDSEFINNSASLNEGEGGAIRVSYSDTLNLINNVFESNFAAYGGAISFICSGQTNVNYDKFRYNVATNGSALYLDEQSGNVFFYKSEFLDNKANASELFTEIDYNSQCVNAYRLTGNDNYINAIYSDTQDILFEDVDYWAYSGIVNSNDVDVINSFYEIGQTIIFEFYDSENNLVKNDSARTNMDYIAKMPFYDLKPGVYTVRIYHPDDTYYTYVKSEDILIEVPDNQMGDFDILQKLIDELDDNQVLKLSRDFTYTMGVDEIKNGIEINSRNITIDGNGKTINALNQSRIFNINGSDVLIKNLTFTNATAIDPETNGGAVYINSSDVIMENVEFINNTANNGSSLYVESGKLDMSDSILNDKNSIYNDGEAILTNLVENAQNSDYVVYNGGTLSLNNNTFNNLIKNNGTIITKTYINVLNNAKIGIYEDSYLLTADVTDDNGNIIELSEFSFIDEEYLGVDDFDGTHYSFEYNDITYGAHIISASTTGLKKASVKTATLIRIQPTDLELSIEQINNGEKVNLTAKINPSVEGNITIMVNNIKYPRKIDKDGMATLTLENLIPGTYNVLATYPGSELYMNSSDNGSFVVKFNPSTIILDVDLENAIVKAIVTEGATGNVTFIVDGVNYTRNVGEDLVLDAFAPGVHNFVAIYNGDELYAPSNNNSAYLVDRFISQVTVSAENVEYGNDAVIVVEVPESQTGSVTIWVNDESYTKNIEKGRAEFNISGLTVDYYPIAVLYNGDSVYDENENASSFNVTKGDLGAKITAPDVTTSQNTSFILTVPDDFAGKVKITVDGITYDGNPDALIQMANLTAGDKKATVQFYGDSNYKNQTLTVEFNVRVEYKPVVKNESSVKVEVKDSKIVASVANGVTGNVTFIVNDREYSREIVDGKAVLEDALVVGNNSIVAYYPESDDYNSSMDSAEYELAKLASLVKVSAKDISYGSDAVIDVEVPDAQTGTVTITVGGKNYTEKLENAKATFTVPGLSVNSYSISVKYNGDSNYDVIANSSSFKVTSADLGAVVEAVDVSTSQNASFILTVPDDFAGKVKITVDGITYDGNPDALIQMANLTAGDKKATVEFYGDSNYKNQTLTVEFNVRDESKPAVKNESGIKVEVKGSEIVASVADGVTGNVTFIVNDREYSREIVDGKAVLEDALVVGNNSIVAYYPESDDYNSSMDSAVYELAKLASLVKVSAKDISYGSDAVIDVEVPDAQTGTVTITVGGKNYTEKLENAKATFTVPGLSVNPYSISVKYNGDSNYDVIANSSSFKVIPADLGAVVEAVDVSTSQNASFILTVPDDFAGKVKITVDGETYDGNPDALIQMANLTAGDKKATVELYGDSNYKNQSLTAEFKVTEESIPIDKKDANVTVDVNDDVITVNVPEDATGNVTVSVNGEKYSVPIKEGKAVLSDVDLKEGKNTIIAIFEGDDNYNGGFGDKTFEIESNSTVIISVENVTKYFSGPERFVVNVTYKNGTGVPGIDVLIKINGVTYERTTNTKGIASIALNLNSGNYTAEVEVPDYNFTSKNSVEVLATIYATDVTKIFRNGTQYYGLFLDGEGNPLVNTEVSFNINGVFYKRTTNASGWARLNLNLEKGTYILTAINPATSEMRTNIVTVISQLQTSDLTKYYRNDSQFVVRVRADDGSWAGAGEVVKFNVHGRLYERTTNATGHAVLNINLEPEEYIITSYYKECREGNSIEVLPVLTASDLTMKYKDGSQFKAKLVDGQGKPYAGQKISFNINGVFYSRTTGSDGVAKLNINLQSGQYIITSEYNEYKISNTIKIGA